MTPWEKGAREMEALTHALLSPTASLPPSDYPPSDCPPYPPSPENSQELRRLRVEQGVEKTFNDEVGEDGLF
jgi:hypothetical protein